MSSDMGIHGKIKKQITVRCTDSCRAGKALNKDRTRHIFQFKAKLLQETISMMNYGQLKRSIFSLSVPVLLLIVTIMTMVSGCGNEDSQNISGQVTAGGAALTGVKITMTGDTSTSATTDANGNYTFGSIQSGTIIVTPSLNPSTSLIGYTFSPPSRTVLLLGIDLAGLNFSGYFQGQLATSNHTVYVKNNGTVWTWGSNSNGQLGNGTTGTDSSTPAQVSNLTGIIAIAAGFAHTVALKNDGTVLAWGSNSNGQLGNGTTTDSSTPVQVSNLTGITAIAAGFAHTVALKNDGTVWAWGSNSNGQLGNGTMGTGTDSSTPVQVIGLAGMIAVAAGQSHSVALRNIVGLINDGTVWAWGSNSNGQLGNGTAGPGTDSSLPVQVSVLTGVTAIAAGSFHTVAVRNIYSLANDGTVWVWGSNASGQLGDGTVTDEWQPVIVSGLPLMVTVAAGLNHTIALRNDGTIWTWGSNSNGQLGDGTQTDRPTPLPISDLTGVTAISSGILDNIVLKNDGTLSVWGVNNNGQLGDGTTTDKLVPTTVLIP
jgi:alpha-tubulin suppressor-like RCC1 family protein